MKLRYRLSTALFAGLLAVSALNAKEALTDAELHSVEGGLCSVCDGVSPQSCPGLGTSCSGTTQLLCGGTFTGCEGGGDQTECSFGLGSCNADGGSNNACGSSTSTTCLWEEIGDGLYACTTSVTNTGACPKKDCSGTVL
jgi:hypothetical protein